MFLWSRFKETTKLCFRAFKIIMVKCGEISVADPELNLGGVFLESRRAEWGGYGRGVPCRWWGFGGPPPRKF